MTYYQQNKERIIEIPVSSIKLKDELHKSRIFEYQYQHKSSDSLIVLVRRSSHGYYALVSGWDDYLEARNQGFETIKAIVTNENYGEFYRQYGTAYVPIDSLVVSPHMGKCKPAPWKMERVRMRLGKKMQLDKPITVDRNNIIRDGYTRYLVAKEIGMKFVPIWIIK